MNMWNRNDDRKEEKPPYSRVFVVCSKDLCEEDLRVHFEEHGEIEDLYIPRDRNTGKSRGVAYVKYSKTSSAAAAIQEMHLKPIANSGKPIKVMVATNKNGKNDDSSEKHNRLFIKIPKDATDADIAQYFSTFGTIESVHIQKDKTSQESKGLAYVQFETFLGAAKAFENCEKQYKAVFAAPKQELKRGRDVRDDSFNSSSFSTSKDSFRDCYERDDLPPYNINSLIKTPPQNFKRIQVTCSSILSQKYIERLCDIVPGMLQFQYNVDTFNGCSKAIVTYEDERAAAYAVEKLNYYEFPSGEILNVKPDNPLSKAASDLTNIVNSFKNAVDSGSPDLVQLADALSQASSLIKEATTGRLDTRSNSNMCQDLNYCSVPLPPAQPFAGSNAQTVKRCFVVCKPSPPSNNVLRDIFSRFGDFIDIVTFPNKTFVFAKYASASSAQYAINALHGATVCGVKLKVLEADEKPSRDISDKTYADSDQNEFLDLDRKRIRLNDKD